MRPPDDAILRHPYAYQSPRFTKGRLPAWHPQPVIRHHQTQAIRSPFLRRKTVFITGTIIRFFVVLAVIKLHVLHNVRGVNDRNLALRIERHAAPLHATGTVRIRSARLRLWWLAGCTFPHRSAYPTALNTDRHLPHPPVSRSRAFQGDRAAASFVGKGWVGEHFTLHGTITLRHRTLFNQPGILTRQTVYHKKGSPAWSPESVPGSACRLR